MRRRLDLAASLVGRPDVLFLDEPTTGLDPRSRIDVWSFIRELQEEGTTLLLTTQYLDEADQLADRIVVIDVGTVIAEGTSDELKDRIGGEVLEIHVEQPEDATRVAEALKGVGTGEAIVDLETGCPAAGRQRGTRRAPRQRAPPGRPHIPLSDIALHKPTPRRRVPLAHRPRGRRRDGARAERQEVRVADEAGGVMSATVQQPTLQRRAPSASAPASASPIGNGLIITKRNMLHAGPRADRLHLRARAAGDVRAAVPLHLREPVPKLPPGVDYVMFLMPGIFVQNAIFGSTTTGDRPGRGHEAAASSTGSGRCPWLARPCCSAEPPSTSPRTCCCVAIVIVIGYLVGFRFQNGFLDALGLVVLVLAVGFAFSWISACIGLALKEVEAVQAASFTWIFPVVFVSSAFVPVAGMADFMQVIARNNPVTIWCNFARYLALGHEGILDIATHLPIDTFEGLLDQVGGLDRGHPRHLRAALDPPVPQAHLRRARE